MKKVLVVGDDNSCRSRMIAALMKHISFNRIDVTSAGIKTGKIEPLVLKVLQEIGVNIEQEKSKSLNEFIHTTFDIIITTTPDSRNKANTLLHSTTKIHKELQDPRMVEGDAFDKENAFRELRDEVNEWLNEFITRHRLI